MADHEPQILEYPVEDGKGGWAYRKIPVVVPKGKEGDSSFLEQVAQGYLKRFPSEADEPHGAKYGDIDASQPKDQGLFSTLGKDIAGAPKAIMDTLTGHPLEAVREATEARRSLRPRAVQAYKSGDYSSAAGLGLASIMPFVGPQAVQSGEEIGGGQPGQGLAHGLEAIAPFIGDEAGAVRGVASKVAKSLPVQKAGVIAKGAAKGAWEGATAPSSLRVYRTPVEFPMPASVSAGIGGSMAGEFIGRGVGHPEIGTIGGGVIGATAPAILGAVRGAKEAYKNATIPGPPPEVYNAEFVDPSPQPGYPAPDPNLERLQIESSHIPTGENIRPASSFVAGQPKGPATTMGAVPLGPEANTEGWATRPAYPPGTSPESSNPTVPLGLPAPPPITPRIAPPTVMPRPPLLPAGVPWEDWNIAPSPPKPTRPVRLGEPIPLAPAERVPGTGKFGPKGTREVRREFYGPEPKSKPAVETAKPEVKPVETPKPTTKPVKSLQDQIKEINEDLKSRQETKETANAKPGGTETESKGTETKEIEAAKPEDVESKGTKKIESAPNSITTLKEVSEDKLIDPNFDKLLATTSTSGWSPGDQIPVGHVYDVARLLNVDSNVSKLARALKGAGYNLEEPPRGWGLKVGKGDLNTLIQFIGVDKFEKLIGKIKSKK